MNDSGKILDEDFIGPDLESDEYKNNKIQLKLLKKKVNRAGNFLFAIGLITLITKVIPEFDKTQPFIILPFIAISLFYIGMGFLSTFKPVIALSLALAVYIISFPILVSFTEQFSNVKIYVRILVCIIMIVGIVNAIRIEKLQKELGISG